MRRAWEWLALLAAILYSLYLHSLARPEVFYSGDGGLKALMVGHLAQADPGLDIVPPAEPWVRGLWSAGYYPFAPPWVYRIGQRQYTQYSFAFPLLSTPFYLAFGARGLLILPLLALWGTWLLFLQAARHLGLPSPLRAVALLLLAFCTPLTFYGACFWEHTLAVFLGFWGVASLRPASQRATALWRARAEPASAAPASASASAEFLALAPGLLLGLAVWFREETACLLAALALLLMLRRDVRSVHLLLYSGLVLGLYAVLNLYFFGHPLGTHAFSVLNEPFSLAGRALNAWRIYGIFGGLLLDTMPMVLFLPAALVAGRDARSLLWLQLLFFALVPWILPDLKFSGDGGKQWGPRFLLPLAPLLCLQAGLCLRDLARFGRPALGFAWLVALGLGGWGGYQNVKEGASTLAVDYEWRVWPALRLLRMDRELHRELIVVVRYQHMAQELLFSMPEARFFRAETQTQLRSLAQGLFEAGHPRFVRMLYRDADPPRGFRLRSGGVDCFVRFVFLGNHGIYDLYEGTVERAERSDLIGD